MKNKLFHIANMPKYGYDCHVHPHGELALVGYFVKGAYSPLRAFFYVQNLYASTYLYGEAGEGHFRVCRFPFTPVDQPFSALPPSFGREWQSSFKKRRRAF